MKHYSYRTENTCSSQIEFDIDGEIITGIRFTGGCNGNLKALSKILDGWTVEKIESMLGGNTCGRRPTSCADQLSKAVRAALTEEMKMPEGERTGNGKQ